MPTLYTMPGTCALSPNIAAAWVNAPITIENLDYGDQRSDAYLEINPRGKVPALLFEDGDVLTEAAAILEFIGAEYGNGRFGRATPIGRKEAEALSYLSSEVHAAYGPHFAPQRFAQTEAAQEEVRQSAYTNLAGHFENLEADIKSTEGDWYLGKRTFADTYLYVVCRWIELIPLSIDAYPALKSHRARMEQDDGVQLALERQGMTPVG